MLDSIKEGENGLSILSIPTDQLVSVSSGRFFIGISFFCAQFET